MPRKRRWRRAARGEQRSGGAQNPGDPPGPRSWPGFPLALSHGRGGQGALPPRSCRPRAPAPGLPPAPGGGRNGGKTGAKRGRNGAAGGGEDAGSIPTEGPRGLSCPGGGSVGEAARPGQTPWGRAGPHAHRAAPATAAGVSSPGQERPRPPRAAPHISGTGHPRAAPLRRGLGSRSLSGGFPPASRFGLPSHGGASSCAAATTAGGASCLPGWTLRSCGVGTGGEAPLAPLLRAGDTQRCRAAALRARWPSCPVPQFPRSWSPRRGRAAEMPPSPRP